MEDATHRQVKTLRPEIQSQPDIQDCSTPVHKVTTSITHEADPVSEEEAATEAAHIIQTPEETTTTQVIHVATVEIHNQYRSECKAFKVECYLCHRLGHFAHMCRTYLMQDKNDVKHIDTNEEGNPQF